MLGGAMCAKWSVKRGFDPGAIAARLEGIKSAKPDRTVSYRSPEYDDCAQVLASALDFDKGVPEIARTGLLRDAIFAVGREGPVTAESLLSALTRAESVYLSKPGRRYVIATHLSIRNAAVLKRMTIGSAIITVRPQLPRVFSRARVEMEEDAQVAYSIQDRKTPHGYWSVRASINARGIHEAGSQALRAIDLTRAILNLALNHRWTHRLSTSVRTVNKVTLGPLHTLHLPSGELATRESWWYEVGVVSTDSPLDLKREWPKMEKYVEFARRRLRASPFRLDLEEALWSYVRALDERDYDTAIMKLWAILERLTGTGFTGYRATTKRVAFLYKDYAFHRQVLNHLRHYRNQSVHADKTSLQRDGILFQAKRYVEDVLFFLLRNGPGFRSLSEANEFMALSADVKALRRKRVMLDRAIQFRA